MFAVHCLSLLILVVVDPSHGASSSDVENGRYTGSRAWRPDLSSS
jgi:hypothetical protein